MKEEMLEKVLKVQKNIIVEGDISTGKTTNILFPIVQEMIDKKENIFIVDSKEEYINHYYEQLETKGYHTIVINLRDLDKSEGWNPLLYPYYLYKNNNIDKAIEYLDKIGRAAFYEENEAKDSFWTSSAIDFFKGVVLALFEGGKEEEINFNSVNNMFSGLDKKYAANDYLTSYFETKHKEDMAYIYASSTLLAPKETRGGIVATARQKLRIFVSREKLSQFLNKTTFDFEDFRKPTAIIFIAKDEDKSLNSLLAMFIEQLYGKLIDLKRKCKFNFILDNFDVIDYQNGLTEMLGSCLSRNIKVYIATRSVEDMDNKYGRYIEKLCDLILIKSDKITCKIDGVNEDIAKEFVRVNIQDSDVVYPTLKKEEVAIFNIEEKAIEAKRKEFIDIDPSLIEYGTQKFKTDELMNAIAKKVAKIDQEEASNIDIHFKTDTQVFNYRVAAIIRNKDKILVTLRDNNDYVTLIGGRCMMGETSIEAVKREVKEESGYDTRYIRSGGLVENFYISRYDNKPYHELLIIHELEFIDKEGYTLREFKNFEEENARFKWMSAQELKEVQFEPKIILDYINEDSFYHLINK